ncbi:MAG: hypothetical protein Q8L35_02765 [Actinomycetota bacterium]|nr:hypothetical protein [Actinomycetota bacterium]
MPNLRYTSKLYLAALTLGLLLWAFLSTASAAGEINITKPVPEVVIPESNDFATVRFADPWDMNRYTDLSYGQYMNQLANVNFNGGIFSARTTGNDPALHPLFPGYEGVVFNGRDGFINRIDTKKYNRFSIRLYASRTGSAQLFWFYDQRWTNFGVATFHTDPGWHTYIIDPTLSGKWTGQPIGLRFDPTTLAGVDFKIDWMRLYKQAGRRVELAWTDQRPRGTVDVYLDTDTDPANDNMQLLGTVDSRGNNSYMWDPSAYQPGSYYFYIDKPGSPGVYSKPVVINRTPLLEILDPDEKGGEDYATVVTGDPWDMGQRTDVWYWDGVRDVSFSGGVMAGNPTNGDSYFHLRVSKPIDTDKYHRLTFRFRYDGPFDYGAGTMSRVIWSPNHDTISLFQTVNDIVTYPSWQEYSIDLKKAGIDGGSIGWKGMMKDFRFDPLEWQAQWRFYVDYIHLQADDSGNKRFTIKWRDARKAPRPTRVGLYYDKNRSGFNGNLIAADLPQIQGTNSYVWRTSKVPAGLYYVYAVANDGVSLSRRYSSGPVKISH